MLVRAYRISVRRRAEGKPNVGSAFFISSDLVATAFHVVGTCEKRQWTSDNDSQVTYELSVESGRKVRLEPLLASLPDDVAVLRVAEPFEAPNESIMTISTTELLPLQNWSSIGYPAFEQEKEFPLTGEVNTVRENGGPRAITLFIKQGTSVDWGGISGAPIVTDDGVSGIITQVTSQANTVWAALPACLLTIREIHQNGLLDQLHNWISSVVNTDTDWERLFGAINRTPGMACETSGARASWFTRMVLEDSAQNFLHLLKQVQAVFQVSPPHELRQQALAALTAPRSPSKNVDSALQGYQREIEATRKQLRSPQLTLVERHGLLLKLGELKRKLQGGHAPTAEACVGRYQLLAKIGAGGFGSVWRAWDDETNTNVAIKILHPQFNADKTIVARFERGAKLMRRFSHPYVTQILDQPAFDGKFHFFVMPYMNSDLCQDILKGRIEPEKLYDIILCIGDALTHLHNHGAVHRDVKPANILLDADQNPSLSDFDLGRGPDTNAATIRGTLGGTVVYSAPELLAFGSDSEHVGDPRSDIYSLGMSLLFGIYGSELPHQSYKDTYAFLLKVDCPNDIKKLILRATASQADDRYASMQGFCQDLRSARHGEPISQATIDFAAKSVTVNKLNVRQQFIRFRRLVVVSDTLLGGDSCTRMSRPEALAEFISHIPSLLNEDEELELVFNGNMFDLVSYSTWENWGPTDVAKELERLAAGPYRGIFQELKRHLAAGHYLTIIVGSREVDLVITEVQHMLRNLLGAPLQRLQFVDDGNPYRLGTCYIEPGHYYDSWNTNDSDEFRSYISQVKRSFKFSRKTKPKSPGNLLTSRILNPIRQEYSGLELLWPDDIVMPVLQALDPKLLRRLLRLEYFKDVFFAGRMAQKQSSNYGATRWRKAVVTPTKDDTLRQMSDFVNALLGTDPITNDKRERVAKRLIRQIRHALHRALAGVMYVDLQATFADRHLDFSANPVIMGSNHFPAQFQLSHNRIFLSTGSWSDYLFLPAAVIFGSEEVALESLKSFLIALASHQCNKYLVQHYVCADLRLSLTAGTVEFLRLLKWEPDQCRLNSDYLDGWPSYARPE